MDVRDTPEQAELRRTARRLARELGPESVIALDDRGRRGRLATAVRSAGWLHLRDDAGDGTPLASGVEAAILAEAMGEAVADVPFAGVLLAADLARRAGVRSREGAVVGFAPDLLGAAIIPDATSAIPIVAIDTSATDPIAAYVLVPDGDGYRLGLIEEPGAGSGADLTRVIRTLPAGLRVQPVPDQTRCLTRDDLTSWTALGLALTSADLVGAMRGVLDVTVAYARERRQYGVAIGTFQAVQHLLAEAHCLLEGAFSAALYPAWAVDQLAPAEARSAGRVAKAYCARAARTACETAVQVHGGIGNTWDCIVHVYLRRALLSAAWFGDDTEQLRALARERCSSPAASDRGGRDGLS
jgi:alkylation response protein AidB-like acyl-CoA dehydrogenase